MGSAILVLSWPILVESFLQSLVGLTDTVFASGLSDAGAGTDAVGGAAYILWFIGLVVQAIGVGATALISRAVGGRSIGVANAAVGQTLLLALLAGVVVGVVILLAAAPAAALLNLTPSASEAFRTYVMINAFGVPFSSILFSGIACARGAGESLRPLWSMVAVNTVNVLASWVLAGVDLTVARVVEGEIVRRTLLANPFPFDLGVSGIAWGTVLGHMVGAAIVIRMLARGTGGVRLKRSRLRPHWPTLHRLIRIGVPNFFETLGMWAGNFLVILIVGLMGGAGGGTVGAHFIAIRIEAFSFLPGFAFGAAAATLAGQYLGAGSPALAARAVWICTFGASLLMGLLGVVFVLFPHELTGLVSPQAVHLDLVPPLLVVTGFVQVPFAISIVLRQALRGAGDVRAAMWITWAMTYGVRLPLVYLLSDVAIPLPQALGGGQLEHPIGWGWGLTGVWVALCVEILARAIAFLVRFSRGRWQQARV